MKRYYQGVREYRSQVRQDPALRRQFLRQQRRLGERLRALRKELGLTQEAAAAEIGLSPKQLWRLESGEVNATLATLVAVAVTYGVEPWELLAPANVRPSE